ncbi:GumC domain-containing protein [Pontiella sulfatireligans]|uniref:Uncharacterized protein n=1 Tax=Pontiella sulfatireligans TaxID=2750658 RepID=A0A6C2ULQ8_9BACT|nr:hypothetical protein [Pontiella sulfatireligans]VGO20357.1 hypothetical protein SCARR_02420 [Pontiella sulfatireligans]
MTNRIHIVMTSVILSVLEGTPNAYLKTVEEPLYAATARISVFDDSPAANPEFVRTQIAILQSEPIQIEVINRLDLRKTWGKNGAELPLAETLQTLKNCTQIYPHADTSLIAVSVKRSDPNEAAKIANEIANTSRDSRLDILLENARRKNEILAKVLKDQLKRVDEAKQTVEQIKKEHSDQGVESGRSAEVDKIQLRQIETDRLMAQLHMTKKAELRQMIESEKDKKLIDRASRLKPTDTFISSLIEQLQDVKKNSNSSWTTLITAKSTRK